MTTIPLAKSGSRKKRRSLVTTPIWQEGASLKSNPVALLGGAVLAGFLAVATARAQDAPARTQEAPTGTQAAPANCEVPAYPPTTESTLPKVENAVKSGRPLDILVVESWLSSISASEGSAWPVRLQAMLKQTLPKVPVSVSVELHIKKTAEEVAAGLVKLVEVKKPDFGYLADRHLRCNAHPFYPDDFRGAVGAGVAALKEAGADVVLMDRGYSPRTETMISVLPNLDNMLVVAQQYDVPLFDRFAIMRHWMRQDR